jgi:ATP-dependent DNA ligase
MAVRRQFITLRTEPPREPEGFILPCIPTFAHVLPEGPQWVYEIKHDGYRFQCRRAGKRLHVYSRWGVDWAAHVPGIVEALSALPARSLTIDGEGRRMRCQWYLQLRTPARSHRPQGRARSVPLCFRRDRT